MIGSDNSNTKKDRIKATPIDRNCVNLLYLLFKTLKLKYLVGYSDFLVD